MVLVFYMSSYVAMLQNHFQVIERAQVYDWDHYLQCPKGGTPKAGNSELCFLCSAHHIVVIYICIKFQNNISNIFKLQSRHMYYRNHDFQCSKGHNSKSSLRRVTVLVFCTSAHDALHFIKIYKTVCNLLS